MAAIVGDKGRFGDFALVIGQRAARVKPTAGHIGPRIGHHAGYDL